MDLTTALAALQRAGTAQTRKTYLRHGAKEPLFGVSYADLYALQKKIGQDDALAEQLWNSGNHDARILATLIAEPAGMTNTRLEEWLGEATNRGLAIAFPRIAAQSPVALAAARNWIHSHEEFRCAAGWWVLGTLAADPKVPDETFATLLTRLQRTIHSLPNFARYAANMCLIGIGGRPGLRKAALTVADRVGDVDVDHGDTDCKTPNASEYILKMAERQAAKADGKPTKSAAAAPAKAEAAKPAAKAAAKPKAKPKAKVAPKPRVAAKPKSRSKARASAR